jgi:ADP-ribose pyrophosphatase YjhB (NUDIX family)
MDLSSHGIVALVRDTSGKYLLLEDAREQMKGLWAPPHGRCEQDDGTEEKGVVREVKEETGLIVIPIKKIHTQPADTKVKTVSFWLVDSASKDVTLDEESSASGWFTVEEALNIPLYPGTRQFFEMVRDEKIILDQ